MEIIRTSGDSRGLRIALCKYGQGSSADDEAVMKCTFFKSGIDLGISWLYNTHLIILRRFIKELCYLLSRRCSKEIKCKALKRYRGLFNVLFLGDWRKIQTTRYLRGVGKVYMCSVISRNWLWSNETLNRHECLWGTQINTGIMWKLLKAKGFSSPPEHSHWHWGPPGLIFLG